MITIVDYGIGNLGSIENMLKKVGAQSAVTADPAVIQRAEKLVLPGVGSFDAAMERLVASGLIPVLEERVHQKGVPLLGVCLGMQLMTKSSEEGSLPGLGWINATTVRFDQRSEPSRKVPHMGWNTVKPAKATQLISDLPDQARFYFVHSYYVRCAEPADVLLRTRYGTTEFDAAFQHENVMGVQFHPEKSHRFGMWLLRNFAALPVSSTEVHA